MRRKFISFPDEWNGREVLSIIGPTGTGKTRSAVQWVQKNFPQNLKAPLLISVDSVAVYKHLDIGSAKPDKALQENFRWTGIDLFDLNQPTTATDFIARVQPAIFEALNAKLPVILVGGSHFYERALVEGVSPGGPSDPTFQSSLSQLANVELHQRLEKIDPRFAGKIHPNDRYRLTRYLDLVEHQGLNFDDLASRSQSSQWNETSTLICGLEFSIEALRERLARRIDEMFAQGWIEEVKNILQQPDLADSLALKSVGYFEIVEFLKGQLSQAELKPLILTRHQQLAKKQRTWLRGLLNK